MVHDGDGPAGLYGGQVAAQALRAAAATVDPDRHPHSLHGYFLSRGDASRRVLLTVYRDRDGRSYSNRRVIAVQQGKVIFNMAASFHLAEPGPDYQAHLAPDVAGPDGLPELETRFSLHGIDIRVPEQPRAGQQWPSRVWLRARDALADETLHACALTYVSDMFTGLAAVPGIAPLGPPTSIDHAVWFYRRVAARRLGADGPAAGVDRGRPGDVHGPDLRPGRHAGGRHRAGIGLPHRLSRGSPGGIRAGRARV